MAKVQIADVIVPSKFNPYVNKRTMELSALAQSGIISTSDELNALASGGGKYINMPYWNDLDSTSAEEILSDSGALTPTKITAGQDVAALFMRGKAWSANDLAGILAGSDPMAAIGDKVASYWARRQQHLLFNMLDGVFGVAAMSTNVHDVSAAVDGSEILGAETVLDAKQKLGDAAWQLTAISMHSAAYTHLQKQNLIAFVEDSVAKIQIPTYLGYRVIVDDGHRVDTGVYESYLFGAGAIGFGQGQHPYPTETDRDKLAGDDILINRQSFVLHPRGVKFTGASVTGATPSNTEVATAANWAKVYDTKDIRIVKLKYKLG